MDLLASLKISASGLQANKKRMSVISSNIANAQTVRTNEGGPYKKREVVFESGPTAPSDFLEVLEGRMNETARPVNAMEVVLEDRPPLLKYEPNHPDADEKGYVAYPNINVMEEMANMIQATRAYESNLSAMNATKRMAKKALEIGE